MKVWNVFEQSLFFEKYKEEATISGNCEIRGLENVMGREQKDFSQNSKQQSQVFIKKMTCFSLMVKGDC